MDQPTSYRTSARTVADPPSTVRSVAVTPEHTGCVVVLLPEHISSANAEQILNRLVWVIDHGAAVLVADLTATSSCDSSGARALLQAYQCGAAAGTELRLVVTAEAVRRALRLGGLAHLVLMFATPAAALADLRECRGHLPGQALKTVAMSLDAASAAEPPRPPQADHALLDSAVGKIFKAALSLHDLAGVSPERVADALENLDGAVGDIREYAVAATGQGRRPLDRAGDAKSPQRGQEPPRGLPLSRPTTGQSA